MSVPFEHISADRIYAVYGKALFLAQSMEIGMRLFYWLEKALPQTPPGKSPRVDFKEDPLLDYNVYSLGGFIRQFRKELMEEGTIDTQTRSIMRKLEQSVADRNWLVHSYWEERAVAFNDEEGRLLMNAELQELMADFRYHDLLIRQMVLLLLSQFNLKPEDILSESFQSYIRMAVMPE
jgi:hypothetical protein